MPAPDYQLEMRDGAYWLGGQAGERKVWHETRGGVDYAYIEPCGATPDGLFIPMGKVLEFLDRDVIAPHERDEEYEEAGIGFDPVGGSDTDEQDLNVNVIAEVSL